MKIGFDAKRAFLNYTGLGNYSRNIIRSMLMHQPNHEYYLFTTSVDHQDFYNEVKNLPNVKILQPRSKLFNSYWKSYTITSIINKLGLDVYHGLSNELPFNISKSKAKKVVTIHDLIPFKEDVFRNPLEDYFYKAKLKSACKNADAIVAISKATKRDIEDLFKASSTKIEVIYQPVILKDASFYKNQMESVKNKYQLPNDFILQVGTIEYRKNVQIIIKALMHLKDSSIHYVLVGKKRSFFKSLSSYANNNGLFHQMHYVDPINDDELGCIYLLSKAVVYPSMYEGFGLPVVEGIFFGKPVLTTQGGCFEEAGGPGAYYCDTTNVADVAQNIKRLLNTNHEKTLIFGKEHIQQFNSKSLAEAFINTYLK